VSGERARKEEKIVLAMSKREKGIGGASAPEGGERRTSFPHVGEKRDDAAEWRALSWREGGGHLSSGMAERKVGFFTAEEKGGPSPVFQEGEKEALFYSQQGEKRKKILSPP